MRTFTCLTTLVFSTAAFAAEPFAVTVSGSGTPAMIFIPGLACSGDVWKETVDHFKGKHECHVLTLAGFAGQPPIDEPFFNTITKAIANYASEKKLVKPIIVGHRLGASLALKLAADHGDTIGSVIAVDGFACTMALFVPDVKDEQRAAFGNAERDKIMKQSDAEYVAESTKMFAGWLSGKRLEQCHKWIEKSDRVTVAKAKGELFSLDVRPALKKSTTRVLLLAGYNEGMKQFIPDKETYELKIKEQLADVKNGSTAVHPNCKHCIMWDEPKWMTEQIELFLKN